MLILICSVTLLLHLSDQFWVDEFYTLIHFVLVPVKTTLLDYHVPNNHILFSLLSKLYLSVIGYSTLIPILENPVIARLPLAFVAIATLYIYWKISAFYFNDIYWRMISMILLSSNAVFGNFVLQFRGYGISMLFLGIIFLLLNRLLYSNNKGIGVFLGLMLASFSAFYTIPSNLYFIVAMGIFPAILYLKDNRFGLSFFLSPAFKAGAFLLAGILLGLLAYSPVFEAVFNNDYVNNATPFAFSNIERFIQVLLGLSSFYYLLLAFGIYHLVAGIIQRRFNPESRFLFPVIVILLPVVFSFLHGDVPPNRVYTVILPVFSLLLTKSLMLISDRIHLLKYRKASLILPFFFLVHFFLSESYISWRLAHDNSIGKRNHSLLLQYHNYHFNSGDLMQTIQQDFRNVPVYCKSEMDGISLLTDAYGIPISIMNPDSILADSCIFITNKPFAENGKNFRAELINEKTNYFVLYLLRRKH